MRLTPKAKERKRASACQLTQKTKTKTPLKTKKKTPLKTSRIPEGMAKALTHGKPPRKTRKPGLKLNQKKMKKRHKKLITITKSTKRKPTKKEKEGISISSAPRQL